MASETRSLHRKLAQVMYEAERIPKNGTAPREMGGYKFVQVGDAADYIRKALAEKVITMMPTGVQVVAQHEGTTKSGAAIMTVDLITEWTLTDGESGESIKIMSYGAGADMGDKYSGKASTSAMKYALLTGFLLSTGEDTEAGTTPERKPRGSGWVDDRPFEDEPNGAAATQTTHRDGLVGKAIAQGNQDFELHQSPEGFALPFRIKEGRLSQIVVAEGELALQLFDLKAEVLGKRITVWGHYTDESYDKGAETITYKVLHAEKVAAAGRILPGVSPLRSEEADTNTAAGHEHWDGTEPPDVAPGQEPLLLELLDPEERALVGKV